jgi:signal transduction histidine kinase
VAVIPFRETVNCPLRSRGGRAGREQRRLIGLSDCVEALGGTIEVVSPLGGGTSLLVTLSVEDG